jgi:hypothetical protein
VSEQAKCQQNVNQGLMIGNNDIGFGLVDFLFAMNGEAPGWEYPQVPARPKTGEKM